MTPFVMAGLVPAIHVFAAKKDVDARDKRGHDTPPPWLASLSGLPTYGPENEARLNQTGTSGIGKF
jgi:hypothetical protein